MTNKEYLKEKAILLKLSKEELIDEIFRQKDNINNAEQYISELRKRIEKIKDSAYF
jgi:hypothetical protein